MALRRSFADPCPKARRSAAGGATGRGRPRDARPMAAPDAPTQTQFEIGWTGAVMAREFGPLGRRSAVVDGSQRRENARPTRELTSQRRHKSGVDRKATCCDIPPPSGEVSEWSMVPDSKSGVGKPTEGSNPSLSANATPARAHASPRGLRDLLTAMRVGRDARGEWLHAPPLTAERTRNASIGRIVRRATVRLGRFECNWRCPRYRARHSSSSRRCPKGRRSPR